MSGSRGFSHRPVEHNILDFLNQANQPTGEDCANGLSHLESNFDEIFSGLSVSVGLQSTEHSTQPMDFSTLFDHFPPSFVPESANPETLLEQDNFNLECRPQVSLECGAGIDVSNEQPDFGSSNKRLDCSLVSTRNGTESPNFPSAASLLNFRGSPSAETSSPSAGTSNSTGFVLASPQSQLPASFNFLKVLQRDYTQSPAPVPQTPTEDRPARQLSRLSSESFGFNPHLAWAKNLFEGGSSKTPESTVPEHTPNAEISRQAPVATNLERTTPKTFRFIVKTSSNTGPSYVPKMLVFRDESLMYNRALKRRKKESGESFSLLGKVSGKAAKTPCLIKPAPKFRAVNLKGTLEALKLVETPGQDVWISTVVTVLARQCDLTSEGSIHVREVFNYLICALKNEHSPHPIPSLSLQAKSLIKFFIHRMHAKTSKSQKCHSHIARRVGRPLLPLIQERKFADIEWPKRSNLIQSSPYIQTGDRADYNPLKISSLKLNMLSNDIGE